MKIEGDRKIKDIEIQEVVQLLLIENLGVAISMSEVRWKKNSIEEKTSRNYGEQIIYLH